MANIENSEVKDDIKTTENVTTITVKNAEGEPDFEDNSIPVVFITDNGYVVPTSVAITSLICNKKPTTKYSIFILTNELSKENEQRFKSFNSDDIKLEVITVSTAELEGLHKYEDNTICQATPAALLKFKLPMIFGSCKKIIYLDGDILVQNDLSDLYSEDISGYYVAAVHDTGKLYHNKEIYKQIPSYFNSGVMLLNLEKCREDNMTEKLIEEKRRSTDNSLMDQNVLNIVFSGHVKIIDIKYNFLILNLTRASAMFKFEELNKLFNTNYKNLSDIEKHACVLHFSSKDKPWKFYDGPYSKEWYNYFLKSPHKDAFLIRSKFVLNEFNSTQRKALIVELNPCHGECIPGYAKYFLDLGYDLRIIMNNEIEADDPLADIFSNKKVEVGYMSQPDIVKFIQNTQQMNQYSVCLFNSSFIYKFQKLVVYLLSSEKYQVKILTVDHRQELINRKIQARSNSVVLKQFDKNENIFEVNPHYFGKHNKHEKNSLTEFVVVGGIDEKRKNHGLLISAIDKMINSGENDFHVTVVGKGSIDNLPESIKSHITLTGRLSFPQMYEVMKRADFFLPLLDYDNPEHLRYCTTGTSGSFQLIYGFNLPCIIDANFAKIYSLTDENCIPYDKDKFTEALIQAVKMNNDEYSKLQDNLAMFVQKVYQNSLEQMRDAIETDYRKEPFPIMTYVLFPYYLIRNIFIKRKKTALILSNITNLLHNSRIDIKNFGQADNAVEVTSDNGVVTTPKYLTSDQGVGQEVNCKADRETIKIKIKNDGKLVIRFRGIAKQYNGTRFPIWTDYESIKINGLELLSNPVATWHDEPYSYEMPVRDGQEIVLEVVFCNHKYDREELKTTIQKCVQYKGSISDNISEVLNVIENKYISKKNKTLDVSSQTKLSPKLFDIDKEFFIIDTNNMNSIKTKLYGYIIQNKGIIENENIKHLDANDISGCGTYVYIERKGNSITIKQDFNGSYGLYLFETENYFALSNSFFYLLDYLKNKFSLEPNEDYMNYMLIQELCSEAYSDTPIKDIKLLDKDAIVRINTTTSAVAVENIDYKISQYSVASEDGLKILDKWFEKWTGLFRNLKDNTNNIKINLSGGFDSRLTFLLALQSGINLNEIMVYSINDSLHTHVEDYQIASEIAKYYDFNLNKGNLVNDAINFSLEDIINIYVYNKLPFHKELKCGYKKFKYKHYSFPGAGGENLRSHWDYTIQERTDMYIQRVKRYKESVFERLTTSVQKIANPSYDAVKSKYHVEDSNSIDIPRYLYMETRCRHHFGRESVDDYFANSYILSPLLDPNLLQLKLTTEDCTDNNLLYSVIFMRYCPQLLNFKFEGNRAIDATTIDWAKKINNILPYKPKDIKHSGHFNIITDDKSLLGQINSSTSVNTNMIIDFMKGVLESTDVNNLIGQKVDEDIIYYALKNSVISAYYPLKEIYPLVSMALILHSLQRKNIESESHYNWLNKQISEIDEATKHKRELEQKVAEITSALTSYRIDIKNFGTEHNNIEVLTTDGKITEPAWYTNSQGIGKILQGNGMVNTVKIRAISDGSIHISFRGQDKSYRGQRIPVWIDYKSIKIDGNEILFAPIETWHDEPFKYEMPVKDGQEITLEIEQQYHQYTEDDLKDILLKLYKNNVSIEEIIQPLSAEFVKVDKRIELQEDMKTNYFVSLGENCFIRTVLTRRMLKPTKQQGELSCPFDLCVCPIPYVQYIIESRFTNYFNGLYFDESRGMFVNNRLSIEYHHDKDCDTKEDLVTRYTNRIKNFLSLRDSNELVFACSCASPRLNYLSVNSLYKAILSVFRNTKICFIFVNISKDEMQNSHKLLKEIQYKHIPNPYPNYYSEWFKAEFFDSENGRRFEDDVCRFIEKASKDKKCFHQYSQTEHEIKDAV